jgi:hypothetical protein
MGDGVSGTRRARPLAQTGGAVDAARRPQRTVTGVVSGPRRGRRTRGARRRRPRTWTRRM